MNIDIVKTFLKCPISRDARHKFKEYLYEKSVKDLKLIMTLLVKDEEDIINIGKVKTRRNCFGYYL